MLNRSFNDVHLVATATSERYVLRLSRHSSDKPLTFGVDRPSAFGLDFTGLSAVTQCFVAFARRVTGPLMSCGGRRSIREGQHILSSA